LSDVGPVFDALADENRRRVLGYLAQRETATATELARELPVTRQAVAKHLAALREAGLVSSSRLGRETRYRLTPEPLAPALDWLVEVGAAWDARLDALRRHLVHP
jgi:ArsR family transcriptional regulator, cadmium/lead-responsive transcriptional repressor